jgi:pimeloyl-ACP methyl ester carboxylesterase
MFRDLMPLLAGRFRLVAPDLPGFGQSAMPTDGRFQYTFENLAQTKGRFTEALNLERFAVYVFDYGAPVGLRMALKHPERITAIISQNGNAYDEGLSAGWDPMKDYWSHPTAEYRESLRAALTPEATRHQYIQGVVDSALVSPDGSSLDDFYLARPGAHEVQLSLFTDYGTNVALYPKFQEYLRSHRPPLLAVWGKTTPTSSPPGLRPSDAIYRMPTCACSTPGTSLWKPIVRRLRRPLASSWKRTLRNSA